MIPAAASRLAYLQTIGIDVWVRRAPPLGRRVPVECRNCARRASVLASDLARLDPARLRCSACGARDPLIHTGDTHART